MKLSVILTAGLLTIASAAPNNAHKKKYQENDRLAHKGMANLKAYVAKNGYPAPEKCTLKNASVRKEWSSLSKRQRRDYIKAVQCLGKLPAKTPASVAPGAKSRYDDLVVTHIQQAWNIHGTANFLAWHRYYTWTFEQMLRNECGYKGAHPYYNWAHWADNPKRGPFFDGSSTSMSGDGSYIPGRNYSCFPFEDPCLMKLQPGSGGGCVTSGPFKHWKTNMGPLQFMLKIPEGLPQVPPNPQADGLGYNPRCLRRDMSQQAADATTDFEVSSLIKNFNDIATFQTVYQGEFAEGRMGVHTGGHYTIGGDAGSDFFNSPADPAFFPHHGMIDRVWWTWQNQDIESRQYAIAGGTSIRDPGGRNGTLDDLIGFGEYVGAPYITIRDAMNTLDGPFCYIYA
ncbi:Di-copper centre-containing protein [Decorospora gaudefroyi]|uniref:Di-copper centre-containing protein n=1 Tax=Decorospora gaudefroyi TaxID=184978 RepID=A0A6A5KGL5_9PLEO|nr:Di-copper centre-containing protein [Decorospora gaudefroyi]